MATIKGTDYASPENSYDNGFHDGWVSALAKYGIKEEEQN